MDPFRGFLSAVQWLAFFAVAAVLFGVRIPRRVLWGVIALEILGFGWIVFTIKTLPGDATLFWNAGRAVWSGASPYDGSHILNPPPSLAWYAVLSILPLSAFLTVWRILGAVALGTVTFAADGALRQIPEEQPWKLSRTELWLLACCLAVSVVTREALACMTSSFLTTFSLFLAFGLRERGRRPAAGVLLALGTLKITTQLPFLMLFGRKGDRTTWFWMCACGLLLTLLVIRPWNLPREFAINLQNIREEGGPGQVSDYSFENTLNRDFVSLDYAIYHLGVRNRGAVNLLQGAALVGLGSWVGRQLFRRPRLPRAAECSLVCCFSAVFLYHRLYDMTILAIPIVFMTGRALGERGPDRWIYRFGALGLVWVWHLRINHLNALAAYALRPGLLPRLAEMIILPQATWILMAVMLALVTAERRALDRTPMQASASGLPA